MTFSIIVPFHNEQTYLKQCITSLLHQHSDSNQFQLIFIDNNSTDHSYKIAQKLLRPQDKLLKETTPNVYAARNHGLKYAKGDTVAFTDADCSPDPDWLNHISSTFSSHPKAQLILGSRMFSSRDPLLTSFQDFENQKIKYVLSKPPLYHYGFTNNLAVKASTLSKVGYFKLLPVNGDSELVQRVSANSPGCVIFAPSVCVTHMEITSTIAWLKKMYSYAIQNTLLHNYTNSKNLTPLHTLIIAQHTITSNHYALLQSLSLITAIALTSATYQAGTIASHFYPPEKKRQFRLSITEPPLS